MGEDEAHTDKWRENSTQIQGQGIGWETSVGDVLASNKDRKSPLDEKNNKVSLDTFYTDYRDN